MTVTSYLTHLGSRLARGARGLPQSFCSRQRRFILDAQRPDGGFAGRSGTSDLYYTGFALRAAAMLETEEAALWRRAAGFLRKHVSPPADLADALSLLLGRDIVERHGQLVWCESCSAERLQGVRSTLERFRLPGGAFAKRAGGEPSLYHTFLAALAYEILGEEMPGRDEVASGVLARQLADGGFADGPESTVGGTNPTAAAVGLLRVLGKLDGKTATGAGDFLLKMQRLAGGFAAHADAPAADLMSTFTALLTLADVEEAARASLGDVGRFARSLAVGSGGFRGAAADVATDLEYTYYGLGTLALLADHVRARVA